MNVLWLMPFVIVASTVLGALFLQSRRSRPADPMSIFSIVAVPRSGLAQFRTRHPHLLTIRECLRWLSARGFDRFRRKLLVEVLRMKKEKPQTVLLVHFAVVTKDGYLTSGPQAGAAGSAGWGRAPDTEITTL
jgi:hypothetical protein